LNQAASGFHDGSRLPAWIRFAVFTFTPQLSERQLKNTRRTQM
jgi:hypothetical protein